MCRFGGQTENRRIPAFDCSYCLDGVDGSSEIGKQTTAKTIKYSGCHSLCRAFVDFLLGFGLSKTVPARGSETLRERTCSHKVRLFVIYLFPNL